MDKISRPLATVQRNLHRVGIDMTVRAQAIPNYGLLHSEGHALRSQETLHQLHRQGHLILLILEIPKILIQTISTATDQKYAKLAIIRYFC